MKIRVPLTVRTTRNGVTVRPEVTLRVRSRYGDFIPVRFVVDTGADFTTVAVPYAEGEGIPFSRSAPGVSRGLVGATNKYRDRIHLLIAGVEYDWPCDFLEPPPLPPGVSAMRDYCVLGRAGFLDVFEVCIADTYLTIIRPSRFRRWCRRIWRTLRSRLISDRRIEDPL